VLIFDVDTGVRKCCRKAIALRNESNSLASTKNVANCWSQVIFRNIFSACSKPFKIKGAKCQFGFSPLVCGFNNAIPIVRTVVTYCRISLHVRKSGGVSINVRNCSICAGHPTAAVESCIVSPKFVVAVVPDTIAILVRGR